MNKKGFTLVELLAVIVILALIATVTLTNSDPNKTINFYYAKPDVKGSLTVNYLEVGTYAKLKPTETESGLTLRAYSKTAPTISEYVYIGYEVIDGAVTNVTSGSAKYSAQTASVTLTNSAPDQGSGGQNLLEGVADMPLDHVVAVGKMRLVELFAPVKQTRHAVIIVLLRKGGLLAFLDPLERDLIIGGLFPAQLFNVSEYIRHILRRNAPVPVILLQKPCGLLFLFSFIKIPDRVIRGVVRDMYTSAVYIQDNIIAIEFILMYHL